MLFSLAESQGGTARVNFFGIGAMEIAVILMVALVALGPKRLPQTAQKLGVMLHQARRQVAEARQMFTFDADLNAPPRAPDSSPLPTKNVERAESDDTPGAGPGSPASGIER